MEIDCPTHAVAIWLEGDQLWVRFPDQQRINVHVSEFPRIISILRHRASAALTGERMTIGTLSAPVQYDLERPERDREQRAAFAVRKKMAEADALLALVGLA